MRLCVKCFSIAGIVVKQPQMLKHDVGCKHCKSPKKKTYDIIAVVEQTLKDN